MKFLLSLFILSSSLAGQTISPFIFGQNANLTAKVGIQTNAGGSLDTYWDPSNPNNPFRSSGTTYVRYSGIYQENRFLIDGSSSQGFPSPSNIYLTYNDYVSKRQL